MYTIIRHYKNHQTGETWTRNVDKTYKTKRNADAAAERFSVVIKPDGKTATAEYSAEVVSA
ncbi:hypothetical protein JWZ98_03315 [Methylomonas sp. EFPC1]|uniref:hypothetical protein n=1 Tax=Methylomonas sp. EFPC1 TaxID=2812647 RepID=UPI001966FB6D|nr:hypothetical protein [Methylomonas sp. EFPC1]QSB02005.1 hypothetical protein JWZ98_03315 [Methylomonas sp. EFPC1]